MLILGASKPKDQRTARFRWKLPAFSPHFFLILIILLAWPGSYPGEAPSADDARRAWNPEQPEWREGPVRYLISSREDQDFEALTEERDRAAFVSRFWASRDPDPYSTRNEAEEVFWERVADADHYFASTTISGWRTDRGRIYILLGAPDEISNYPLPSITELDPSRAYSSYRAKGSDIAYGQRGAVEWIYRSLSNPRATAGQLITFIRDETGEFRISKELNPAYRWEGTPRKLGLGGPASRPGNTGLTSSTPGSSAGKAGVLTGSPTSPLGETITFENLMVESSDLLSFGQAAVFEKALPMGGPLGRVRSSQFFGVIPVQTQLDYFQDKEGTRAMITVGLPVDDLKTGEGLPEEIHIFGRLEMVSNPTQVYQFSIVKAMAGKAPRQEIDGRPHQLYQVRGVLPPGAYRVNLGARIGDKVGTVGNRIQVPDYSAKSLILAGPMLAQTVGEKSSKPGGADFAVGKIRLVPKLDHRYENGSEFAFYFQAYHAARDPADGKIHLDIDYRIAKRRDGFFVSLGEPVILRDNTAPAHAYTFPLEGWDPGEYLLTVTIEDRILGKVQTSTAAFRVR